MAQLNNNLSEIVSKLKSLANPDTLGFMANYGITPDRAYGVKIPELRRIAKSYRNDHELATALWNHNTRETRILATMIDDPKLLTEMQMEAWALEFDYWEICDQCCMNLFEKHSLAWQVAIEWSTNPDEGKKRAAFVLMARLAVSDKNAVDEKFEPFFPLIVRESIDERNLVKKAVNWALRQIGKRNLSLNQKAITVAREIHDLDSKSARWIANDALRELKSEAVQNRLN
ncbi:MAG: DNA alkylation repair protein [Candidatus Marinimicrobia bacterium]|nr:DNA alkylation repair protein [bacterium]MCG2714685.1 DNA alkylation repair protein [Candidatus Neomarinimicrobiota bacterium]